MLIFSLQILRKCWNVIILLVIIRRLYRLIYHELGKIDLNEFNAAHVDLLLFLL